MDYSTPLKSHDLSGRNYDEKRNFIRMQVNIEAFITDHTGLTERGRCINLSGGGALLELDRNLPANQSVAVKIHSPYGHSPVLDIKGHVIRGQEAKTPGKYWVAMCYR